MSVGADPRIGSELAGYRIERLLGRGGMGIVYRAEDLALDRKVALKLIAPELAEDERFRSRFLRESRLAASIDHSHIVPIYDAGESGGQLYIAMRYVEGTDLKSLLEEEGSLEPERALALLGQAASALDAAHERGLVHRDVKPGNLLITSEAGRAEHVYLTDFGLTRERAVGESVAGVESVGQASGLLGTIDYAAPEQIEGKPVDQQADVYSFGCVLFESLTGEPPFPNDLEMMVAFSHVNDPPPVASERNPALPQGIDPVIQQAMAKEPADRYPSATGLVEATATELLPEPGILARLGRRGLVGLALVAALIVAAIVIPAVLLTRGAEEAVTDTSTIRTVAGNGTTGYSGDGGLATGAGLAPGGIALDADGNLYIADEAVHGIRKVDRSSARITTVAGTGVFGFSGDGGPATEAEFGVYGGGLRLTGAGIAIDGAGNIYIADLGNRRIRMVDTNGLVTTMAGTGREGSARDGGPATEAQLLQPVGLAIDAVRGLYVAEVQGYRVRRVDPSGMIMTVAGTGTQGFSGDGGAATSAQLNAPIGIALDSAGNLFIADSENHRVRKVSAGGTITTVAGTGTQGFSGDGGAATSAQLSFPSGIAFDSAGNLFIADTANRRIRKVDAGGTITTVAGTGTQGFSGDGGPASEAELALPRDLTVDRDGNLYIVDFGNSRVRKVTFER